MDDKIINRYSEFREFWERRTKCFTDGNHSITIEFDTDKIKDIENWLSSPDCILDQLLSAVDSGADSINCQITIDDSDVKIRIT